MKIESLRDLTKDELLQKHHDLKEELFNLNMRKALKELDNPLKLRTIRRDIARIETLLTEDRKKIRTIVDTKVSILDSVDKKSPSETAQNDK